MAIHLAAFAFGGLLLLVAILGGGFEVKELKVPKVGRASRIAACACGLLFVFMGIHLDRPAAPPPPAAAPEASKIAAASPAVLPQIVLVSAQPADFGMRLDSGRPRPAPELGSQPPPPSHGAEAASQAAESREAPADLRTSPAEQTQPRQAVSASSDEKTPVPWEQKPRQWLRRFRGKGDSR